MKIIQIFNNYLKPGGEEVAVAQISEELAKRHELLNIHFDIHEWKEKAGLPRRAMQLFLMAWNPKSMREVSDKIRDFSPDLIVLHNLMPMGSAGLYYQLSRCGIPTIHFIHNFRPFSVNGYSWGNGRILTEGLDKNFIPEILAGSWQDSRIKTAWYALLLYLMHRLDVYRRIDGWIAISHFMRYSFERGGISPEKIRVIPHFWRQSPSDPPLGGGSGSGRPSFLFLGRISEEKGVRTLLDAWEILTRDNQDAELLIAGDGPLGDEVSRRCGELPRARFLGFKSGAEKQALLANCTALVVPSVWWEPLGLVLYEAYGHGKPVLAARSGGIVDHVTDGETGWIHQPGDAEELAGHFRQACANSAECQRRGANGKNRIAERSPENWLREFDSFAEEILSRKRARQQPVESAGEPKPILAHVYLADQNPGFDRSFGISRMTRMILQALHARGDVRIEAIISKSSQQAPPDVAVLRRLPWSTRNKTVRLLTDHLHPAFTRFSPDADIHYYPKGYLPLLSVLGEPSVVTIHDTIIQYSQDHYPERRPRREYAYWSAVLKHTIRHASVILTVSESAKKQIKQFIRRHGLPQKEITVTYEPCAYEGIPQPLAPAKENFVIHLASHEPHKRTSHFVQWWMEELEAGHSELPALHLIGKISEDLAEAIARYPSIVKRPFLSDEELQRAYTAAVALILPSEIEGFGLPALEAYYLGTPVCFVKGTSVEEILGATAAKGGFSLDERASLFRALKETGEMQADEIRAHGLRLRETYAVEKVVARMTEVFRKVVANRNQPFPPTSP